MKSAYIGQKAKLTKLSRGRESQGSQALNLVLTQKQTGARSATHSQANQLKESYFSYLSTICFLLKMFYVSGKGGFNNTPLMTLLICMGGHWTIPMQILLCQIIIPNSLKKYCQIPNFFPDHIGTASL